MKTLNLWGLLLLVLLVSYASLNAQSASSQASNSSMNTYLIERDIEGAGDWTAQQLKEISQASCQVVKEIGPSIIWVHSYVTDDKLFCIYQAPNENLIRTHAEKGGFPLSSIHLLATKISPQTAQE